MHIPHSSMAQRDFDVSMTPMIDVVFLLLIFFVCTASFEVIESVLPSHLAVPEQEDVQLTQDLVTADLERVLIGIAESKGRIHLSVNGQSCASLKRLSEILNALSSIDATLPVALEIEDDARLGTAIDVYDRCRLANFQRIQFVAEASE